MPEIEIPTSVESYDGPLSIELPPHANPEECHHRIDLAFDGSYQNQSDIAAVGYVLKHPSGDIIERDNTAAPDAHSITETEATACLTAVQAARKYTPECVRLQSDCKPVVDNLVNNPSPEVEDLYFQIMHLLQDIPSVLIKHVPRESNSEAHDEARTAFKRLKYG